jgi:hypothetical protein
MYSSFRNEVLQISASSGLNHLPVLHDIPAHQNEPLVTDYFYTPEKKDRCLVHISGVHGVEGYMGSLIQREVLKENFRDLPFQLVIVHIVNPYGMAACQRVNPNNVDLNRNSLDRYYIENPSFSSFQSFLKSGGTFEFIKLIPNILKIGYKQTVKAMTCGQTEFPDSVFYAGHELQPELLSLKKTLHSLVDSRAHLYVLDIHTGLGKMAAESLIIDGFGPQTEETFFRQAFQTALTIPDETKGFFRAEGTVSQLLKKDWQSFHIFQEFGTYPPLKVLNALIHRKPDQVFEMFFPHNESWRMRCVDIGLLRFRQLVQTLS